MQMENRNEGAPKHEDVPDNIYEAMPDILENDHQEGNDNRSFSQDSGHYSIIENQPASLGLYDKVANVVPTKS